MLGIDGKDDMRETPCSIVSWIFPHPTLRGLLHCTFSHWELPKLQAQTILLQNCHPVKHAPLLVGCQQTLASVIKHSNTVITSYCQKSRLSQIARTSLVYFELTKNYYCCGRCLIEPNLWELPPYFPVRLGFCAQTHNTAVIHPPSHPHNSDSDSRCWKDPVIALVSSLLSIIYIAGFFLLPTAERG